MSRTKRMYELGEGEATKFWEVWRDGVTVFTRFGKKGMKGQMRLKKESSEALAKSTLDTMVAEKLRQGYAEPGASPPAPAAATATTTTTKSKRKSVDATDLAEKLAALTDDASHLVLADWLQSMNHPLGELIALHQAIATASSIAKGEKLTKTAEEFFQTNRAKILGYKADARSRFVWHLGLIEAAMLTSSATPEAILKSLKDFVNSPVAKQVKKVTLEPLPDEFKSVRDYDRSNENMVDPWPADLKQIAALLPKSVTHVELGGWPAPPEAAYVDMPSFTRVSQAFPHLLRLGVTGSHPRKDPGNLELRELIELHVRFAEPSENSLYLLMGAKLPKLERLTIWIGGTASCELDDIYAAEERPSSDDDEGYDEDFEPYPATYPASQISGISIYNIYGDVPADVLGQLLVKLPKTLKYLGFQAALLPRIAYETIVNHPIIDQLHTLDLSGGYMDDDQSKVLVAAKKSLMRLEKIDVSNNRLTTDGAAALKDVLWKAHIGAQRTIKKQSSFLSLAWHSDEPDRFFMRYVAGKE